MSAPLLTPDEFADAMRLCWLDSDREVSHCSADKLMLDLLESLGYSEGVAIFAAEGKWYA